MKSPLIPHTLRHLTANQRNEIRREYRFLRGIGIRRQTACGLIFRMVDTLTLWVD